MRIMCSELNYAISHRRIILEALLNFKKKVACERSVMPAARHAHKIKVFPKTLEAKMLPYTKGLIFVFFLRVFHQIMTKWKYAKTST